jgi:hypothetical protein
MAIVNMQVTFTLETNMTTEQVTAALKDMVDEDAFHIENRLSDSVTIDEETIEVTETGQ